MALFEVAVTGAPPELVPEPPPELVPEPPVVGDVAAYPPAPALQAARNRGRTRPKRAALSGPMIRVRLR